MSRLYPRSIAGQLISLIFVALVVSQVLTLFMFFGERDEAVREAWRAAFAARVASVARLAEEAPPELAQQFVSASRSRRVAYSIDSHPAAQPAMAGATSDPALASHLAAALDRPNAGGIRIARFGEKDRSLPARWVAAATEAVTGSRDREQGEKEPYMLITVPFADGRWFNVTLDVGSYGSRWALVPLASTLLTGLATLMVVIWMVRRITRPLRNLAHAAENLGRGDAVARLVPEGPDELRTVAEAFNRMSERLTRFVADRTRMLAAISHDLRTPITALRVRAEFIDDDDTREHIVQTLDDMKNMTEAALSFARDDAGAEEMRVVDLTALVDSLISDLSDLGYEVSFDDGTAMPVSCRPASLKRAIANLLQNAVRYGRRAHVALARSEKAVTVTIDDQGPGIPEERMVEVFEPFVRLEGSRSRETGGVGLGLAIARSIVLAHGGDLALENRSAGGLRAQITLPL